MPSPTADPAVLSCRCRAWGAWVDRRANEVTLSRKGAKSRTHGRKLRSSGTKARTRVGRSREPRAELERKLAEALEQQAATSEVLQIISSSPGELRPVFEAMLANAARICEAKFGVLYLYEDECIPRGGAAWRGRPSFIEARRRHPMLRRHSRNRARTHGCDQADGSNSRRAAEPAYRSIHCACNRRRNGRPADRALRPDAEGSELIGAFNHLSPGGPAVHRQADRAGARISPPRPSSPSRTPGCSTSCAIRCSSRPPPPRCLASSRARPASWSLFSGPCWKMRCGFARRSSVSVPLR